MQVAKDGLGLYIRKPNSVLNFVTNSITKDGDGSQNADFYVTLFMDSPLLEINCNC